MPRESRDIILPDIFDEVSNSDVDHREQEAPQA